MDTGRSPLSKSQPKTAGDVHVSSRSPFFPGVCAQRERITFLRDGWHLSPLEGRSRAPGPSRLSISQGQGRKPKYPGPNLILPQVGPFSTVLPWPRKPIMKSPDAPVY